MKKALLFLAMVLLMGGTLIGMLSVPAVAAPDLAVNSITYDDVAHRVAIVVRNGGNTSTNRSFYVDLFVDPKGTPALGTYAPPGMYASVQQNLDPGKTVVVHIPVALPSASHTLYAIADTDYFITGDTNRDNNRLGPVTIGGTGKPDLVATSLTFSNGQARLVVTNKGDVPVTRPFYVDYFPDPNTPPKMGNWSSYYTIINGLGAQQSITLTAFMPDYWGFFIVDSDNLIYELDETNNLCGPVRAVQEEGDVDLIVRNVTYNVGAQQFTVSIENIGTKSVVDPFSVDLFIDKDEKPAFGDPGDISMPVENVINPGEVITVVIDSPLDPQPTPHLVWAIVNNGNPDSIETTDPDDLTLNNIFGPKSILVKEAPGPDVAVTGLEYEQATGITRVLVKNLGNQAVPNFFAVSLFVDPPSDQDPKIGDESSLIALVPAPLAPGATYTAKIQTSLSQGIHQLVAIADSEQNIAGDLNLANNVSARYNVTSVGMGGVPDLLTTLAYSSAAGQATVTVTNVGTGTTGPFGVKLYKDTDPDFYFMLIDNGLAPGASASVTINVTLDANLHTLKAVADEDKMLPEPDATRANNTATITASGQYNGPDLIVTSVRYERSNHTAYVKIKNQGLKAASAFKVALWFDFDPIAPPVPGDQDYTVIAEWPGLGYESAAEVAIRLPLSLTLGTHNIRAIIDNNNDIQEGLPGLPPMTAPEELNNTLDSSVQIAPVDVPDLVITDIYWNQGLWIRVQNQSIVDVNHYFFVDAFVDWSSLPAVGSLWSDGFQSVISLARGQSKDVLVSNIPSYYLGPGQHIIAATVDGDRYIPEYYEDNNVAGHVWIDIP